MEKDPQERTLRIAKYWFRYTITVAHSPRATKVDNRGLYIPLGGIHKGGQVSPEYTLRYIDLSGLYALTCFLAAHALAPIVSHLSTLTWLITPPCGVRYWLCSSHQALGLDSVKLSPYTHVGVFSCMWLVPQPLPWLVLQPFGKLTF